MSALCLRTLNSSKIKWYLPFQKKKRCFSIVALETATRRCNMMVQYWNLVYGTSVLFCRHYLKICL